MTETHYIPAFAPRGPGRSEQAICGEWVTLHKHSTEPTCAQCKALIDEEEQTARALEAEFPDLKGRLVTEPHEFDETDLALGKE